MRGWSEGTPLHSPPPLPPPPRLPAPVIAISFLQGINEGKADEWLALTTRNAIGPGARELPPSTRKTVEGRALEWVRRNRGMLPRLALPPPSAHAAGGGAAGGGGGGGGVAAGGKAKT